MWFYFHFFLFSTSWRRKINQVWETERYFEKEFACQIFTVKAVNSYQYSAARLILKLVCLEWFIQQPHLHQPLPLKSKARLLLFQIYPMMSSSKYPSAKVCRKFSVSVSLKQALVTSFRYDDIINMQTVNRFSVMTNLAFNR